MIMMMMLMVTRAVTTGDNDDNDDGSAAVDHVNHDDSFHRDTKHLTVTAATSYIISLS